ncbi:MAG: purine/pyrimidine permease [Candidatus Rokubacteria bacterium]|nr:purine/pyrimidine permease [Candidatus Rokubacteria bacterium]
MSAAVEPAPAIPRRLAYGVDDKPPTGFMVVGGFQHVLTLFGATTLVPLIFGPQMGMDTLQLGVFVASVYFCMGIATLLQISPLGSRLPIVQGSSFSFIPPVATIIAARKAGGVEAVMAAIGGALALGGIVEALVGYLGLAGAVRRVITPVVIGPVIMLIGFSLAPVAVNTAAGNWGLSVLVVIGVVLFSLGLGRRLQVVSVLLAVLGAYLVALILSLIGVAAKGTPSYVDLSPVAQTPWWLWPQPFRYGLELNLGFFAVILAAYFASTIESIGDYHSISYSAGLPDPEPRTISKGIGSEGVGCIISGAFGGVGTTSYTENIGLVNITGVASRYVVGAGAVILVLMSLLQKFGTLVATIPSPVVGGAYIALFGIIGALGIQVLSRADLRSQRNLMIVGMAFLVGLGLPPLVQQHPPPFQPQWLADIIGAILRTGMAVGGIVALILDNVVPGTREERGIRS